MSAARKRAAIWAGLLGSAAWAAPECAWAQDAGLAGFSLPFDSATSFLLGCASGAAVTGAAVAAAKAVSRHRHNVAASMGETDLYIPMPYAAVDDADATAQNTRVMVSDVDHGAAQGDAGSYAVTPEVRDAQASRQVAEEAWQTDPTAPNPPVTQAASPAAGADSAASSERQRRARLLADLPQIDLSAPTAKAGPAPAPATDPASASAASGWQQPAPAYVPAPACAAAEAAAPASAPAAASGAPAAGQAGASTAWKAAAAPASERDAYDPSAQKHSPEITDDLTRFAQNYAQEEIDSQRREVRSRGVFSVLKDRIGKSMFDDLPVIQRADGTVGDVGTDWWDMTFSGRMQQTGAQPAASASGQDLTVPGWAKDAHAQDQVQAPQQQAAEGAGWNGRQEASNEAGYDQGPAVQPQAPAASQAQQPASEAPRPEAPAAPHPAREPLTDSQRRSAYIAKNIAEVDEGVYPAKRSPEELDHEDLWEQALSAMSQRLEQMQGPDQPVFSDVVGGSDSIDDPEGLEAPTSFIPFRVPAAHPEVVDTDSYVDYLIDDEFSRNESQAARNSSRDYLRVLQGGTQTGQLRSTRPLRGTRSSRNAARGEYRPKHMARAQDVREA